MAKLTALDTVRTVASADDVADALKELDVTPYAAFAEPNAQLLTQVRQDGENMFLYVYNYCPDLYCGEDHVSGMGHGREISTEIIMDGMFVPYRIDSWSGKVTEMAAYRYEDGKTVIPVDLSYGDIALYAFEAVTEEKAHVVETSADLAYVSEDAIVLRTANAGEVNAVMSDGSVVKANVELPAACELTNWDVTVESWTPGEEITRTETMEGIQVTEHTFDTVKNTTEIHLDTLTTWNNIPEIGQAVSGRAVYRATFDWDGAASGACIDFGEVVQAMTLKVNGQEIAVDLNKPVADIGHALVEGKNTIEIEYGSNLTNVQLDRGLLREQQNTGNWEGYDVAYREYGLRQATLIPYAEVNVQ